MKRTSPLRRLLRMGRASAKGADPGRVRFVALLLATAVLSLGLSAVAATYAVYDGIEQRTQNRALQFRDAFPSRPVTAMAVPHFDKVEGRQFALVHLRPLSPRSAPPPGVDRWPAPGEAVLSPALARDLRSEGASERYGRIAGTIRDEGLAHPGERYAYVNPTDRQLDTRRSHPVVGFGDRGMPTGDIRFIPDRATFLPVLLLLLVPGAVLAFVAVRLGSPGRDRRRALLGVLGVGRAQQALFTLAEAAVPVAAGAVVGTLPALWVTAVGNVPLPWVDYWLSSADLRNRWPASALAGCGGAAVMALLLAVFLRPARQRTSRSTRRPLRRYRVTERAAFACPLLLFATVWGPAQLDPARPGVLRDVLYTAGVVAVLATLPCAVAVGVAALGSQLARRARREGAPVAGRYLAAHRGVTVRLAAGVAIALALVSHLHLEVTRVGENARAAQVTASRVGDRVLLLKLSGHLPRDRVNTVLRGLPAGVGTLAVYPPSDPGSRAPARIQGACPLLRSLQLRCPERPTLVSSRMADPRLVETLRWISPVVDRFEVRQGAPLPGRSAVRPERLVLVASDGGVLPRARIEQTLRDSTPVASAGVGAPGAEWLGGARDADTRGRWIVLLGLPGLLTVALALALAGLSSFLDFGRGSTRPGVLAGRRSAAYASAAWALAAPLSAAFVMGAVAAGWLAAPREAAGDGVGLSGDVLAVAAGGVAVLTVLIWWWGARAAVRPSRRHPAGVEDTRQGRPGHRVAPRRTREPAS
ncbi:hypothetical protein ACFYYR_17380 [Streptomyces sp. NPDC001922]|uniref:hypothetical protein n=1 Tax=Streptomyces sp. NPDC001922 TaxID=3364624 RepID=UPI0036B06D01